MNGWKDGWMDGSNEGWLCLNGMTEELKEASAHYPPSSLTTFITWSLWKTLWGNWFTPPPPLITQPTNIKAQTPSGKWKARRNHPSDLSSSSSPPHLYISISFLTSAISYSSVGLQVAHLHLWLMLGVMKYLNFFHYKHNKCVKLLDWSKPCDLSLAQYIL